MKMWEKRTIKQSFEKDRDKICIFSTKQQKSIEIIVSCEKQILEFRRRNAKKNLATASQRCCLIDKFTMCTAHNVYIQHRAQ